MSLPFREIHGGVAQHERRHGNPIDVRALRPDRKIADRDLRNRGSQIDGVLQGELVGRIKIEGAGTDREIQAILEILPNRVRAQPIDLKLAVRFDRLHRQVAMPLHSLAELRGPGEGKSPPLDSGGEVRQFEIDRLHSVREFGGPAVIVVGDQPLADFERAYADRRQRLLFLLGCSRRCGLRLQLQQIQRPILRHDRVYEGCIEVDDRERIRAVPNRRQLEIDEQPSGTQQFPPVRCSQ